MVSLLPASAGIDLLKKSLARLSNLALTSGDFSECSDRSELSCSELADRLLQIEGYTMVVAVGVFWLVGLVRWVFGKKECTKRYSDKCVFSSYLSVSQRSFTECN